MVGKNRGGRRDLGSKEEGGRESTTTEGIRDLAQKGEAFGRQGGEDQREVKSKSLGKQEKRIIIVTGGKKIMLGIRGEQDNGEKRYLTIHKRTSKEPAVGGR